MILFQIAIDCNIIPDVFQCENSQAQNDLRLASGPDLTCLVESEATAYHPLLVKTPFPMNF